MKCAKREQPKIEKLVRFLNRGDNSQRQGRVDQQIK
ncbi:Uncharacterised protein [Chlamydia abortus]|nr:Uncharacterised protein [Chlamydia abortus]